MKIELRLVETRHRSFLHAQNRKSESPSETISTQSSCGAEIKHGKKPGPTKPKQHDRDVQLASPGFAAFGSIKENPRRKIVGKVDKSVFDSGRSKQNFPRFARTSLIRVDKKPGP